MHYFQPNGRRITRASCAIVRGRRSIRLNGSSRSCLPAECDVVVKIEIIEPRFYILTGLADVAHAFREELQCFNIAIRAAFIQPRAPLLDFPRRALLWSVLLNPPEHVAIAFSLGELGLERLRRDPSETKPVVVHR